MRELYEVLRKHAANLGDAAIFSDTEEELSRSDLLCRISALSRRLPPDANRIGILSANSVHWATAQIMGAAAGKTIVPLPPFFGPDQLGHIVRDAGVELILCSDELRPLAVACGAPTGSIICREKADPIEFIDGFKQIIYTSGSTGLPKGVRLGARQIAWSARALAKASEAHEGDSYLSIMPLSLLLEAISAIFLPPLVGGRAYFATESANVFSAGSPPDIASLFERVPADERRSRPPTPPAVGATTCGFGSPRSRQLALCRRRRRRDAPLR